MRSVPFVQASGVVLLPAHIVVLLASAACDPGAAVEPTTPSSRLPETEIATGEDPVEPLPRTLDLDEAHVELGKRIFEEPRVSGSGETACSTCHVLSAGGVVPGESRSNHPQIVGGPYNVPTVFNVAFNFRYNWQGKFTTLEEHVAGPMMSAQVMNAGSWEELADRLGPEYDQAFRRAGFPEGVSAESVSAVLAAYQRSLITPDSRFDRYLRGEAELTREEEQGYALFKDVGCITCHQGINLGGNLFQRFGVMHDAFEGRELSEKDYGRFLVTRREQDRHVFRVPSLRNVAMTAPYFHDGSALTLQDAVTHMAYVQLSSLLSADEVRRIVAFLRTLTGEYQGVPLDELEPQGS